MKRCFKCNKKLIIEFKCRCEHFFCTNDRYPEEHCCIIDYKSIGKNELSTKIFLVSSEKIIKI